jgi:uncharacterized protein DUF4389
MPYPVTFRADYVEKRSRLTTFFRLILAIPHLIAVFFYVLAAEVVVFIAWFALLFTGRYPQGMYDFVAGALRYSTRVCGYIFLLTDEYPPFSGDAGTDYPVDLNIAPPQGEYSRLKVLFRLILLIPVYIISYAMQIVAQLGAFLAWFAIVALGRQPKGLQDMTVLGVSYQQRAYSYFFLLTEDWPPFTDDTTGRRVEPAPTFGALPATPPAAGPEHPTSVPPGGYASPEREAAFPSAPPAAAPAEAAAPEAPRSEPTVSVEPAAPEPPAAAPEPPAEAPEPGPAGPTEGDPLGGPATPTSGDPLGAAAPPPPAAPPEPQPEPPAAAPEPPTESSPPSPGDWPDPEPEPGPPSPGDWPDPEPEPGPPTPHADDTDDDEPPPGPFGPSSTNP